MSAFRRQAFAYAAAVFLVLGFYVSPLFLGMALIATLASIDCIVNDDG